jgi:hypothetical protein
MNRTTDSAESTDGERTEELTRFICVHLRNLWFKPFRWEAKEQASQFKMRWRMAVTGFRFAMARI